MQHLQRFLTEAETNVRMIQPEMEGVIIGKERFITMVKMIQNASTWNECDANQLDKLAGDFYAPKAETAAGLSEKCT